MSNTRLNPLLWKADVHISYSTTEHRINNLPASKLAPPYHNHSSHLTSRHLSNTNPTMGGDDYSSAIGGGLKLKGSKPSGIKKKKSKSSKSSSSATASTSTTLTKRPTSTSPPPAGTPTDSKDTPTSASAKDEEDALWRQVEEREAEQDYKTPTEKRHEEMRRKRLEDRLKREGGGRTHKQRVEELNKYLSGLSEHHDMYVFVLSLGEGWCGVVFANCVFVVQAQNRTGITGGGCRVWGGCCGGCAMEFVGGGYGFEGRMGSLHDTGDSKYMASLGRSISVWHKFT